MCVYRQSCSVVPLSAGAGTQQEEAAVSELPTESGVFCRVHDAGISPGRRFARAAENPLESKISGNTCSRFVCRRGTPRGSWRRKRKIKNDEKHDCKP